MKRITNRFSIRVLTPALALGLFFASCASKDTNPPTTYGHGGTDTGMVHEADRSDHNPIPPADSSSQLQRHTDSMGVHADTTGSSSGKQVKKRKVSIMAPAKNSNTAAMEADQEGFYKNTEILPAFPGGQKALERFFEDNIVYPETASENGTEGTVQLSFAVDENGKVFNPVLSGNRVGDGIDEEALRVFKKMPTWTPGRIKGKNVKTRYTLPVTFQVY